ncbi:hypothetical protein [Aquisphaera giovannonii]|uniref:hypothetical protein n=1 Tax=Aquisphaera giovannonii TaxID=406548 RepID=UPI0011E01ADD|nr:hypothetical protein [Aquisphaera giovannonii]
MPRAYAAIYVGDYDSAAWLYRKMPGSGTTPRGQVPLGRAFNPALAELLPVGRSGIVPTAGAPT